MAMNKNEKQKYRKNMEIWYTQQYSRISNINSIFI